MSFIDTELELENKREITLPVLNIDKDIKTLLLFLYIHIKGFKTNDEVVEEILNINLKYIPNTFLKDLIITTLDFKRDNRLLRDIFAIEKYRSKEEELIKKMNEDFDIYVTKFTILTVNSIKDKLKSYYFYNKFFNLFDTRKDENKNKLLSFEKDFFEISNELKSVTSENEKSAKLEEMPDLLLNNLKKPNKVLTNTPLDMVLELVKKEVHIITAETSAGKTAFALDLALKLEESGYRGIYFSCEMGIEQLTDRVLANYLKIPLSFFKNKTLLNKALENKEKFEKFEKMRNKNSKLRFIDGTFTVDKVEDYVKKEIIIEKELDFIVIDYLQLLQLKDEAGAISYERVSRISKKLKNIAKENNICILCVAQMSRNFAERKQNLKQDEKLKIYASDLKDSSQIEQDASSITGLVVTATELDNLGCQKKLINIQIIKQRYGVVRDDLEVEFFTAVQGINYTRMEKKLGYKKE